jgi:hypothetical protein
VFGVEAYPEQLLRGRQGEAWNAGGEVVGGDDVCLARNGAGDIYLWNAESGQVRFLVHDEGWRRRRLFDDVDDSAEGVLEQVVEGIDVDQLEDADEAYLARLRLAIDVVGDDALDDEVRDKLSELDVL